MRNKHDKLREYSKNSFTTYESHFLYSIICRFRFMVFNATFNNISVILWPSDLLVEENGVPGENH